LNIIFGEQAKNAKSRILIRINIKKIYEKYNKKRIWGCGGDSTYNLF